MKIIQREIKIIVQHPIYWICMVVMPLFATVFFTSLMGEGQLEDMPIGIVDMDNTATTRKLTRLLDAMENCHVVAYYQSEDAARHAMQKNEIYGFMYFPPEMTHNLLSGRQPKMSFYYSAASLTAGALIYKNMKTVCTLGSAAVGKSTLSARGMTAKQIEAFLQPVALDVHNIGNPWVNYNIYLSVMLVPGVFLLFIFLLTVYALGTEIKFGTAHDWIDMADGDVMKAVIQKLLPHTVIFLAVMYAIMTYMYGVLHFPAPGGIGRLLLLGLLTVLCAQGFGLFLFGLIPSLRLAMSLCSLFGVLSFSMVGSAFPVFAMDAPLQTMSWLFPLRHYYMIYQLCVFNDYPLSDALPHIIAMLVIILLPLLVMGRMGRALKEYEYQA